MAQSNIILRPLTIDLVYELTKGANKRIYFASPDTYNNTPPIINASDLKDWFEPNGNLIHENGIKINKINNWLYSNGTPKGPYANHEACKKLPDFYYLEGQSNVCGNNLTKLPIAAGPILNQLSVVIIDGMNCWVPF